jgi:hypothetical protein
MTNPTRDGWGPCPPGAFNRLTTNLAARRTRQIWLTGVGVAAALVLTAAASWQAAVAIDDWQSGRNGAAHQCQPPPCAPQK